jgi:hypothetical protein
MRSIWLTLLLVACSDSTNPPIQPDTSGIRTLSLDLDSPLDSNLDADVSPPHLAWLMNPPDADLDATLDAGCTFGTRQECEVSPDLIGECAKGFQACNLMGWSACSPIIGRRLESCDGLDNDCDGTTDEDDLNPGNLLTQTCYTGNRVDTKIGVCSPGEFTCGQLDGGAYGFGGACLNQVLPGAEVCDGLDNDCNGATDDLPGAGSQCFSVEPPVEIGECHSGILSCVVDNPDLTCVGEVLPNGELCDGLDNDCDGNVDEELGRCDCENPLFVPRPETCNGVDDDCDGIVDNEGNGLNVRLSRMCFTNEDGDLVPVENAEAFPRLLPPCVGGRALCEQNNDGDNGYFHCIGEVRPGRERCNNEDDDCDGTADEGFANGTAVVVFGIDISGSMEPHEIDTAVAVADAALLRLAGSNNICYIVTVIGRSDEPMLIAPFLGCLPADGNGGVNAREALRRVSAGGWANQGRNEGSWDLIYDVATDDRDLDQDGVDENVLWHHDPDDLSMGIDIDLGDIDHRIVIIVGDERGQTNRRLLQVDVAEQVHASGTLVYVIAPYASVALAVNALLPSYTQLLPQQDGECSTSPNRDYCDYFYPIVRNRNRPEQIAEIGAAMGEIMSDLECYEEH